MFFPVFSLEPVKSCLDISLILLSRRILSINGLALTQVANLLTLGGPPGHSVNMSKNIARKGPTLAHTNIVTLKGHPLPNIDQFKVIDQEKSQIVHEAKEAIHIHKEDPKLNRNIGKMVIPHVFDPILGIKPKNPHISLLLSQESGSQDIGINLMQFHSFIDKRMMHSSTRAQRARNSNSN